MNYTGTLKINKNKEFELVAPLREVNLTRVFNDLLGDMVYIKITGNFNTCDKEILEDTNALLFKNDYESNNWKLFLGGARLDDLLYGISKIEGNNITIKIESLGSSFGEDDGEEYIGGLDD